MPKSKDRPPREGVEDDLFPNDPAIEYWRVLVASEVCEMLGVSPRGLTRLQHLPDFPKPLRTSARGARRWLYGAIVEYMRNDEQRKVGDGGPKSEL